MYFVVLLLASAQRPKVWGLCWCLDSVAGLELEDCQIFLLQNIVLNILYSQIFPEPTCFYKYQAQLRPLPR